ncbi:N-6 DNA methylase [Actinomadura geliboluensis]|uniref:N-6 DNA methylase n=1 Tax=Actinomadura geliboluensis TaxID=882440 RepID=UPI003715903D
MTGPDPEAAAPGAVASGPGAGGAAAPGADASGALVSAADIARLTGFGRAAVSNWRRRYEDFPQPAGGTANSPLFALADVEKWLAGQGKPLTLTPEERLWQLLRTATDDLRLGEVVGDLGRGAYLREPDVVVEPALLSAACRLRRTRGPQTFEYLVRRLVEAHARRVVPTPPDTAWLMAGLVQVGGGRVYDPACGIGNLLIAAQQHGASGVAGQDREPYGTDIARTRLHLNGNGDIDVRPGDSLTADAFPRDRFDAALCDPPFGDRAWGYDDLAGDARWVHGLPPRGEPELAWVQHVLWHLRPGGEAAVLMPQAAADRRSGRRIRAGLLRTGTLRAVLELPAGAAGSAAAPHLWLLRRPADGDPPPAHVLMLDASAPPETVIADTTRFLRGTGDPGSGRAVPLIDLLDDAVDVTPTRHLRGSADIRAGFDAAHARFRDRLAAVNALADELVPLGEAGEHSMTTLGELVQQGTVEVLHPPLTMDLGVGDIPVLTGKDITLERGPSARTVPAPGLLLLRQGDIAVAQAGRRLHPRVVEAAGVAAGPQVQVVRADQTQYDPHFLACFLRAAGTVRGSSASSRADVRRTAVPRLQMEEQRAYGAAHRRLAELSAALRELADAGDDTIALGIEGLGGGGLGPGS